MKNITHFSVHKRNFGHWDICGEQGRLFRIRGNPGDFCAMDERERPYSATCGFKTVDTCMAFIAAELMFEELVRDPKSPGNNIPLAASTEAKP